MVVLHDKILGKWSPYSDCEDCRGCGRIDLFTTTIDCDKCKRRNVQDALKGFNESLNKCSAVIAKLSDSANDANIAFLEFVRALEELYDRRLTSDEGNDINDFYRQNGRAIVVYDPDEDNIKVKKDE